MEISNIQSINTTGISQTEARAFLPPNMPQGPISIAPGQTLELYAGIKVTNDLDHTIEVTLGFTLRDGGFYVRTEPFFRKFFVNTDSQYNLSEIVGARFCIHPLHIDLKPGESYTLTNGANILNDTDKDIRIIFEEYTDKELKIIDSEGHFLGATYNKSLNLYASEIISGVSMNNPVRQNRLLNQIDNKA